MRYQVLNDVNVVVCEFQAFDDVAAKAKFVRLFWSSRNFFYLTRKPEPLYILATNCRKS